MLRRILQVWQALPAGLMDEVNAAVKMLEKELGKKFGDDENPLLFSVRSGAAASMPGMMNTILNLGLTDKATKVWPKRPRTNDLLTMLIAA